jgi:hypothetical protein
MLGDSAAVLYREGEALFENLIEKNVGDMVDKHFS